MLNIILIAFLSNFVIGCLAVILLLALLLAIMHHRCSKYWKKVEKKQAEEQEEKLLHPSLGDYNFKQENGSWDYNLYQSLMNPKIQIREVRVFKDRTEDKDKLVFASSLSFNFNAGDKATLTALIPELTEVSVRNSHELILSKSPAASFAYLKKDILTYLFTYLNRKYDWMNKKMTVSLHYVHSKENLNCHLSDKTINHVRLGVLIDNIPGIVNHLNAADRMKHVDTYQFDINKEESANWDELLPKIQEVFRQYFTGGVEFIGPN